MRRNTALDDLLPRATPILRLGNTLAKLESLRPTGGVEDRALGLWDAALAGTEHTRVRAHVSAGGALAAAAWAQARGLELNLVLSGPVTHEVRETLKLWGHPRSPLADAFDLPPLEGAGAIAEHLRTLGAEVSSELRAESLTPTVLVAPAGALSPLLAIAASLSNPGLRPIALVAATPADVLPHLPHAPALPAHVEHIAVTRAEAQAARARLSRTHGLLVTHASAAAIEVAQRHAPELALALVVANGEREFSLDPSGAPAASPAP
ncbi:MAG: hypothetical protein JST92_00540 [Deltaproteobacteria bacterium]|nr:hypothetical protein [Deltaproteobacteria bacterium]